MKIINVLFALIIAVGLFIPFNYPVQAVDTQLLGADNSAPTMPYGKDTVWFGKFTATSSGQLAYVRILTGGAGNIKVGLYSNNANTPGSLLTVNNVSTAVVYGWSNVTVPGYLITSGDIYWLAALSDTDGVIVGNYNSGTIAGQGKLFAAGLPAIGSATYTNSWQLCIQGWAVLTTPTVTTQAVSSITPTTATGNGNVTSDGGSAITRRGICYSNTNATPTTADSVSGETGTGYSTGAFTESLTSLAAATKYYDVAYATNTSGTTYGAVDTFETLPAAPTSLAPTAGNAQVAFTWANATGGSGTTISTQVQYSSSGYPSAYNNGTTGIAWSTGTSGTITGLTNGTLYYFAAFSRAVNGALAQYSTASAQTTATPITTPVVTTSAASAITAYTAVLNGSQTSSAGNCDYQGFVWGLVSHADPGNVAYNATSYLYNWAENGSYATGSSFNYTATSLASNTMYYFRAVAHNSNGWAYGTELNFTTAIQLTPPVITTLDATTVTTTSAQLNARVADWGGQLADVRFAYDNVTRASIGAYTYFTTWDNNTYSTGNTPFKVITGINPNQTYYFRAQIANDNSTAVGAELVFASGATVTCPTDPVAIPSSENISLNWIQGVSSSNTLVRYQTGSYPTATNIGTLGYTGVGESTQISGLVGGTTYYISLWGLTNGVYSPTYATVMSTTTVSGEAVQTIPPSEYAPPSQWFQAPDYTKMSKFPLYDVINWGAGVFKVPPNTSWFTLAFIFCIGMGVLIYRWSTNIPASAGTIAVTIVFCSLMGLMEMWLVVPFVLIALGAWIQGNRA